MKTKFLFSAIAALLCWSCTSEDPTPFGKSVSQDVPASRFISPDEACEIASQSMKDMGFSSASRSGSEATAYLYNPSGLSRGEASDSLFYVVNFDEGGFALVLAERDATVNPIAISETGTFEDNDNPVAQDYILALSNSIMNSGSSDDSNSNDSLVIRDNSWFEWPKPDRPLRPVNPSPWMVDDEGYPTTTFTTTDTYENFLKVAWRQTYPYNVYCDALSQKDIDKVISEGNEYRYQGKGLVGCTPVAIGQVFSYYKKPTQIDGIGLNWDALTSSVGYYGLEDEYGDALTYTLARIGKLMGLNHGITTPCSINDAKKFLTKVGYDGVRIVSKASDCYSDLIGGQVVLVFGHNLKGKGHTWVADGYKRIRKERVRFDKETGTHYQVMKTDLYHYFSFNWGWGGLDHVYYLVGEQYVVEENDDYTYNSKCDYIINIK